MTVMLSSRTRNISSLLKGVWSCNGHTQHITGRALPYLLTLDEDEGDGPVSCGPNNEHGAEVEAGEVIDQSWELVVVMGGEPQCIVHT